MTQTMITTGTVHRIVDAPVGPITLTGSDDVLTGLYLTGDHRRLPDLGIPTRTGFEQVIEQLAEYFAGERTAFDLALRLDADPFTHRVWDLVQSIPYGEVRSYGQLAAELGGPGLARAVGHANGRNPIAIVVPCHRVIGSDGSLTGYAAGVERKRWLLDHEQPPLLH